MIRATATHPRTRHHALRYSAAVIGVLGAVTLAGCATTTDADSATDTGTSDTGTTDSGTTDTGTSESGSTSAYADGTYSASGSYQTPESLETIDVTITLEDSIITAVEITGEPTASESARYQSEFISGIDAEVVGQSIDDISVSRVAGSSLTSGGFNQAIEEIKSEAIA